MITRPFGRTGRSVSVVGFGAWAVGGSMWAGARDDDARAAFRYALDHGVTFFDTAQVYGDGHSESLIGAFTAALPAAERPMVATKVPPKHYVWALEDDAELNEVFPSRYVEKSVEGSLRRLRTDCLDLLQYHTWSRAFNARDEWKESVRRLKDAGKIRWAGISAPNRGEECVIGALDSGLIESVQIIYNVFQARVGRTVFPELQKRNLAIIVRVPLMEGALTGKFTTATRFPEDDFRAEYFAGNKLDATVERVEALRATVAEMRPGSPLAEVALRFTVSHPAVSTVIPGIRNVEQARMNLAAGDGAFLSPQEMERLAPHEWDVDLWSLEKV